MPPIEPPITRKQLVDAEMVDQHRLRAHHVADGDDRQVEAVGLAGRRIGRGRAGRAEAAADDVGQMTKKRSVSMILPGPISTSHQPGLPVTGLVLATCWSPVSAWQTRMALDLSALSVAVGLVGDLEGRQHHAGVERKRLVGAEMQHRARRIVGLLVRLCGHVTRPSNPPWAGFCGQQKNRRCELQDRLRRRNGPLATCLTWLQADRPNHHGVCSLILPRRIGVNRRRIANRNWLIDWRRGRARKSWQYNGYIGLGESKKRGLAAGGVWLAFARQNPRAQPSFRWSEAPRKVPCSQSIKIACAPPIARSVATSRKPRRSSSFHADLGRVPSASTSPLPGFGKTRGRSIAD